MPQSEKLSISYLISLRSILVQSSTCYQKLKMFSQEDQLRITSQFTLNNYVSYLLTKYLAVFKESRPTLLETLIVLRKKFKVIP